MGLLLLFIDGIGIGPQKNNPLCGEGIRSLAIHEDNYQNYDINDGIARAVDTNLGVPGLPQSATGQTTIFTGINASALIGKHRSGMPSKALRELLKKRSLFLALTEKGKRCAFVNGFTPAYFLMPINKMSATTLHMLYAGMKPRWVWESAHDNALFLDFTNKALVDAGFDIPLISPEKAGKILSRVTCENDFTIYEYFLTDAAGHRRLRRNTEQLVSELDRMIISLLDTIDLEQHSVLLCSDHGNLEDTSTKSQTRNPVPVITWGHKKSQLISGIESITDIFQQVITYF